MTISTKVSKDALIRRINRALAKREGCVHGEAWPHRGDGGRRCLAAMKLKEARGARTRRAVGRYYLLDVAGNLVADSDVHPVWMAREMRLLETWEQVDLSEYFDDVA